MPTRIVKKSTIFAAKMRETIFKPPRHLKTLYQLNSAAENGINRNRLEPCRVCTVGTGENVKNQSRKTCANERYAARLLTCTLALFRCSGNDICLRLESIADNKHQKSPLGSQWSTPRNSRKCWKKGLWPYLFAQFLRPKREYVNLSPYRLYVG